VLAKGCPLDVDGMQPGDCAATVVSHFNVLVHCDGADAFELYASRSLALAFFEWLLQAGIEYGVEVNTAAP
jgi:heterotetrameric sarcosine oxidase gamma subunit